MTQRFEVFGRVRLGVHWCMAALLLVQIPLAWYMIDLPDGASRDENYALHRALGMVIFASPGRCLAAGQSCRPRCLSSRKRWRKSASSSSTSS